MSMLDMGYVSSAGLPVPSNGRCLLYFNELGMPVVMGSDGVQRALSKSGIKAFSQNNIAPLVTVSTTVLATLALSSLDVGGGLMLDLCAFGVVSVGTAVAGRCAIRVSVNGVVLAAALAGVSAGAVGSTQGYFVDGRLAINNITGAWRVDAVVRQALGANTGMQVASVTPAGASISVVIDAQIVAASAGYSVTPRATQIAVI